MRQGPFELLILRSDGTVIAEHELDGKHYIAAEPDTEYKVKIVVHPDENGKLPYSHSKVHVHIDGRNIGYSHYLTTHTTSTFNGFRESSTAYNPFKFTKPQQTGNLDSTHAVNNLGVVKLTVYEATPTDTPQAEDFYKSAPPLNASLQDAKKFWQQPSLQTSLGYPVFSPSTTAPFVWHNVRTTPDATLEIFYHTTDMVAFLKDLHIKKEEGNALTSRVIAPPVHVDLSEVASPVRAPAETVNLTRPAATARGGARVKREIKGGTGRAAKKPRTTSKAAGGGPEVVDLT